MEMTAVIVVSVVFAGIVLSLAIVAGTILLAMKIRHGGGLSKGQRGRQADEARMIQEIYHGLAGLEKRIDALETILMERQGKERNP